MIEKHTLNEECNKDRTHNDNSNNNIKKTDKKIINEDKNIINNDNLNITSTKFMDLIQVDKKSLRDMALSRRAALTQEEVYLKSLRISDRVTDIEAFKKSQLVMVYSDFRNEVMTKFIVNQCLSEGKKIAFPLVETYQTEKKIVPYIVKDVEKDLYIGSFGILEPQKDIKNHVNNKDIDFVLVPGVAFDIYKNRLGYGAGYYDSFLKNTSKECFKAGVAFEVQIFDHIPVEDHDISLDVIITEERLL